MNEYESGKLEQKVEQCLEGINSIKEHIGKIYDRAAVNEKDLAVVKDNVSLLNKVSWTIGSVVIVSLVGALLKAIMK